MSLTTNALDEMANEAVIRHYGTKGMKWGRRKGKSTSSGTKKRAKSRTNSADFEKTRRIKQKPMAKRTNRELQALNNRQNMEKASRALNPTTFAKAVALGGTVIATASMAKKLIDLANDPKAKAAVNRGAEYMKKNW